MSAKARPWFVRLREPAPFVSGKLLGAICIAAVLGLWALLSAGPPEERVLSPLVMPSPGEVIASIDGLVNERNLPAGIASTMQRLLLGFGLAIVVGVPTGILAASWRALEAFWAPLVIFGRNIPIAALIPLTLFWFGIGEQQKVMFIFLATVPFIFSDSAAAVRSIAERYVETAQTLGANQAQIVLKVLVPMALPDIFTSLRFLFGLAFGYIMLAEVVNAEAGLGHILIQSERRGLREHIIVILVLIGLLAWAIDWFLLWLQRGLFPYRKDL